MDRVGLLGIDTKTLTEALQRGEFNEQTAVYSMIKKEEMTDRINKVATAHKQSLSPQQRGKVHTILGTCVIAGIIPRPAEQPRLLVSLPSPAVEAVE
jgi:hypothetical protein